MTDEMTDLLTLVDELRNSGLSMHSNQLKDGIKQLLAENERLRDLVKECGDNMIKWGKGECDFYRYINQSPPQHND